MRSIFALCVIASLANSAMAHFVFIVPQADGKNLKVVFSETLEPDDAVTLGPVAKLALSADGKPVALKPREHHLDGKLPSGAVISGSIDYGVMSRGGQSFLLKYHAKSIDGYAAAKTVNLPAELTTERLGAEFVFRAMLNGRAAPQVEVTVLLPDGTSAKATTDADGRTKRFAAAGRYGAWARVVEKSAGEFDGKKYTEVRHYPTLVMHHSAYPCLPEAVSSFGAAVCGEHVYVFGGHRARVHGYDTTAVTGGFRRLKLPGGTAWEELPAGPAMQGLAMVSHGGKIYRLGGMAPRNAPGQPVDNHSTPDNAVYDPASKTWSPFVPFPVPRSSHDAAVVGHSIVVVGGWNMRGKAGNDWFNDALIIDLAAPSPQWQSVPQPFRRRAMQSFVHAGKVYTIGGLTESGEISAATSIFDPATRKWTDGPELPGDDPAGFNPAITELEGRLYASLGDGAIVRLSSDGQRWEPIAKVAPRIVHRMVPAGPKTLLLLGGAARMTNLDWTEAVPVP